MRINQGSCRRLCARLAKTSATLLKITCLELLSGVCLFLSAQIMTREDLQEQIGVYERASLQAEIPGMPAAQAGRIWSHLGTLYQDAGLYKQSERAFEHAMRLLTVAPVSNPDLATAIDNLGTVYMDTGNVKGAEREESKALRIREESSLKADLPRSWYHLAILYLREHRSTKAREFAERAASAFSEDVNAVPEDKTGSLLVLASSLCHAHQYPEAIAKLQSVLQMTRDTYGPDKFPTGLTAFLLGYAYWKNRNLSSASPLMRLGTEIIGKELGWAHPKSLSVMEQYAQFLRDEHRQDLARAVEMRVQRMRAQLNSNPANGHVVQTTGISALF